jgi:glucose-1-phosphate cytidylyltransferase
MKAVILAGGAGTRLSEETALRPKPMVEIGGKPMLWHIMKIYAAAGIDEFIICLGYKGYFIKEYFANYHLHQSDVTIDLRTSQMEVHQSTAEPWKVTLIDTGEETMTGGRIRRVLPMIGGEDFLLTYGDGVARIDIQETIAFHRDHGHLATMTAVQPPGRFGALDIVERHIRGFEEKPQGDGGWINGGFFVLSPEVGGYIDGDDILWEHEPLQRLAESGELVAYKHTDFWYAMDTLRDRHYLEEQWASGHAPWKLW